LVTEVADEAAEGRLAGEGGGGMAVEEEGLLADLVTRLDIVLVVRRRGKSMSCRRGGINF
jgi:hypothetical protein